MKTIILSSMLALAALTAVSVYAQSPNTTQKSVDQQNGVGNKAAAAADSAGGRGGADEVECKDSFWSSYRWPVFLADLFHVKEKPSPHFFDDLSIADVRAGLMAYLDARTSDSSEVRKAIGELQFDPSPVAIAPVDTGFEITGIFSNCTKGQLATQKFSTGVVSYDQPDYDQLSVLEKGLFELHEGYIRVGYEKGMGLEAAETFSRERVAGVYADFTALRKALTPGRKYVGYQSAVTLVVSCAGPGANAGQLSNRVNVYNSRLSLCLTKAFKEIGSSECVRDFSGTFWNRDARLIDAIVEVQNCPYDDY